METLRHRLLQAHLLPAARGTEAGGLVLPGMLCRCAEVHAAAFRSSSEFNQALLGAFCSVSENARDESVTYTGRGNCMRAQAK